MSARRRHRRIVLSLVLVSASGWAMLILTDTMLMLPLLCSPQGWDLIANALAAARFNDLFETALAYFAMIVAMMLPLLTMPLRELSDRSIPRARINAATVFASAYAMVWLLAAPVFGLFMVALSTAFVPNSAGPWIVSGIVAVLWHMMPIRQAALNRCHRRLALFVTSTRDFNSVARAGTEQGLACFASCAPLMMWAMTADDWHLLAMGLTAAFLWIERLMPPEPLRWGPVNLAQTSERLAHFIRYSVQRVHAAMI